MKHRSNARIGDGKSVHDHLYDILRQKDRSLIVLKDQFVLLRSLADGGGILASGVTLSDLCAEYYANQARKGINP
jgi:hypothetical protein